MSLNMTVDNLGADAYSQFSSSPSYHSFSLTSSAIFVLYYFDAILFLCSRNTFAAQYFQAAYDASAASPVRDARLLFRVLVSDKATVSGMLQNTTSIWVCQNFSECLVKSRTNFNKKVYTTHYANVR